MRTDEERHAIAVRLRDFESLRGEFKESHICAFLDALGIDGYVDWEDVCSHLADLIEPEPERICYVESSHFNDCFHDWSEYETEFSCGHIWFSCYNAMPNYCPDCGAKIIKENL